MEKIETLLKQNMGTTFATPKKINRSSVTVPHTIISDLEAGKFTCEMIETLSKQFPIFRYQTQITIHGNFGDISRSYIGGYKNVFKNECGTVGIRYSAIDTGKIEVIRQLLSGINSGFTFLQNSSARLFRMSEIITKENAPSLKEKYNTIAKRIVNARIYGYVNLYIQPTMWGGNYINLDVHPLAIPQTEIQNFVLLLTGYTPDQFTTRKNEVDQQRAADQLRYQAEREQDERDRQAAAEAKAPALTKFKDPLPTKEPGKIQDGIICKLNTSGDDPTKWTYNFYRINGKGGFGRLKIERSGNHTQYPADIALIQWEDHKQMKPAEIKIIGYPTPANYIKPKTATPAAIFTGTLF